MAAAGRATAEINQLLNSFQCGPMVFVDLVSKFKPGRDDSDGLTRPSITNLANATMFTSVAKCPVTGATFPSGLMLSGVDGKEPVRRGHDDDPEYWYFSVKHSRSAALGRLLDYLSSLVGLGPEYCDTNPGTRPTRLASLAEMAEFLSDNNNLELLNNQARDILKFKYHFFVRQLSTSQEVWTVMVDPLARRDDREIILHPKHTSSTNVYRIHEKTTSLKIAIEDAVARNDLCPIGSLLFNLPEYSVNDLHERITQLTDRGMCYVPRAAIHWDQRKRILREGIESMSRNPNHGITVERLRSEINEILSQHERYRQVHERREYRVVSSPEEMDAMIDRYYGSTHVLLDYEMSKGDGKARQRLCAMSLVCNNDQFPSLILLNSKEMWDAFFEKMPSVFSDPRSIKFGFSVQPLDCNILYQDFHILVVNGIDLQLFRMGNNDDGKPRGLLDYCNVVGAIRDQELSELQDKKKFYHHSWMFEDMTAENNREMQEARDYAMSDATILPELLFGLIANIYENNIRDEELQQIINKSERRFHDILFTIPPKPSTNKKKTLYCNDYFNGILLNRSARMGIGSDMTDVVSSSRVMLNLHEMRWHLALKYELPQQLVFHDSAIAALAYESGRENAEAVRNEVHAICEQHDHYVFE